MTTDRDRVVAANNWNAMWVKNTIEYLESTRSRFEIFETLGSEASDMIDDFITQLECLRTDYEIIEEEV